MSTITLSAINAASGGFSLPAGTTLNGTALVAPSMSNPTITTSSVTSGGSAASSQTVNILTNSLKPRLTVNNGINSLRFQLSTTPTNAGTQSIQFALPSRTTAVANISDISGFRCNARDALGNAINDVIVGGVVASSGTPSAFVQFTANSTTNVHFIDVAVDYIS